MSLFEISSSHEEGFENRTSNKGAQFVPMGVPTVCWKDLNPKNYKDFVNEELQHCFLKINFRVLVCTIRMVSITKYIVQIYMNISFFHFCRRSNCLYNVKSLVFNLSCEMFVYTMLKGHI